QAVGVAVGQLRGLPPLLELDMVLVPVRALEHLRSATLNHDAIGAGGHDAGAQLGDVPRDQGDAGVDGEKAADVRRLYLVIALPGTGVRLEDSPPAATVRHRLSRFLPRRSILQRPEDGNVSHWSCLG